MSGYIYLETASAHITKQPFTQIRKEKKIQKLREDRAGFSSWSYELNPDFTKLVENLGKLVWLHDTALWSHNSSSDGHMAAVTEKHSVVLYQAALFLVLNPAQ